MSLVKFGFSLDDIEKLNYETDIRLMRAVFQQYSSFKEIEQLNMKLNVAEAVNAAIVGSSPDKEKRNIRTYRRWKRGLIYKINKLLEDKELDTIWNSIRKSNRLRRT